METLHAPARTVTPAYEDFSGIDMTAFSNPYDALIAASKDDPVSRSSAMTSILLLTLLKHCLSARNTNVASTINRCKQKQIQSRYSTHRESRNAAQKLKLLAPDFSGVMIDPILLRLEDPSIEPGFVDTRNCLVFWARPSEKVKSLVMECQEKLKDAVSSMLIALCPATSDRLYPFNPYAQSLYAVVDASSHFKTAMLRPSHLPYRARKPQD